VVAIGSHGKQSIKSRVGLVRSRIVINLQAGFPQPSNLASSATAIRSVVGA